VVIHVARVLMLPGAWFIGAAFALHPVHVESVAWITERKNVLSGLFYLLSLSAYLRFEDSRRWRWYFAALAAFIAALLSKTVACTLPVVLLMILIHRSGRGAWRRVALLLPLFVFGAVSGLFTAYLEQTKVGAVGSEWSHPFWQRLLIIAPHAFLFYAGKVLWPQTLCFIYPKWAIEPADARSYLWIAGCLVAVTAAAVAAYRGRRGPLLLLAFSAITLFPALGFANVYPHRFSWVADHFQYLGSLGFIALYTLLATWAVRLLLAQRASPALGTGAAALALLLLGARTFAQSRSYEHAERLWSDTLRTNPDAWLAALNLGIAAGKRGDEAAAVDCFQRVLKFPVAQAEAYDSWGSMLVSLGRPVEAIELHRRAVELKPDDHRRYSNLGIALSLAQRLDEADVAFATALRLRPSTPRTLMNYAALRTRQGRWDEAIEYLRQAVALRPNDLEQRANLADVLMHQERWPEAIEQLRTIQARDPGGFRLGARLVGALLKQGDFRAARSACLAELERRPNDGPLLVTLTFLLATCPDDAVRDGRRAMELAQRLFADAPSNPVVLDSLAAACAEVGDFESAVRFASQAVELATRQNRAGLARRIGERLELYRAGSPYRAAEP
jgi:Flp pilus assembly protein TadD